MENLLDRFWFRLFLVAAVSLYVSELGSMDSIVTRLRTTDFYKEYFATLIISICVTEFVYFVHKRLERKLGWRKIVSRLLLQTILGWFIPLMLVFILATIYFRIYGVDIMRTDYLYYAFPFVVVLVLMLNVIFIMTPYFLLGLKYFLNNQVSSTNPQIEQQVLQRIKVLNGSSVIILEPEEVLSAYIVNGKVIIRNTENKEFLTDITLDELEKEYLPQNQFFRINRQLIASRFACKEYKPLQHNKIEVRLSIPVPVNTVVSQLKSKTFKEWITNDH